MIGVQVCMGSKGGCGRGTHCMCGVRRRDAVCGVLVCVIWGVIGLYGVVGVWGVHPLWGVWELCSVCVRGVLAVDCERVVSTPQQHGLLFLCCPPERLTCPLLPPFLREFSKADLPHTYMCIHMHARTCVQAHAHCVPFLSSASFSSFLL